MAARLLAVAILLGGTRVWALVPGGQLARADCLAEWRVTTRSAVPSGGTSRLDCQDGDPTCDADGRADGMCTFDVSVCILESDPMRPECTAPSALTALHRLSAGLEMPSSITRPGCGRAMPFRVSLRSKGRGTPRRALTAAIVEPPSRVPPRSFLASKPLRLRATAAAGALRDVNRLVLRCLPAAATCPDPLACPDNPAGPPNELVLRSERVGGDLDVGWTGNAHDLPIRGTELHACLEGCTVRVGGNPVCGTQIVTGPGTANGTLLGPPLPVLAAGVPLCLLHEYDGTLFTGGTANVATGAVAVTIGVRAKTFLTDPYRLCPRCADDGRCDGGANDGGACRPDTDVDVGGADYAVSRDCPPADDALVGSAPITLSLTTGTAELAPLPGADPTRPCAAQPGDPPGVPPEPDACSAACTGVCGGDACVSQEPDSATGAFVCLDARGGVGQVCCADDGSRSCFATPVTRSGHADAPEPQVFFPRTSRLELVATLCHPATENAAVDSAVGLPGPAALVMPAQGTWLAPAPCTGTGGPPAPY